MVLRPVLWLGLAYITGELLAWAIPEVSAGMILSGAVCLGIYGAFGMTFGKWGRLRKIKAADLAVFAVLPLFFLWGCLNFYSAMSWEMDSDDTLRKKIEEGEVGTTFVGTLERTEEKTNSWYFFMSGCEELSEGQILVSIKKTELDIPGTDFTPGDILSVSGEPELFAPPGNEGGFNEWLYYHSRKIRARIWADQVSVLKESASVLEIGAKNLRLWIRDGCQRWLRGSSAGITLSMVCGDTSLMDPNVDLLYQKSGISHILAISGLHITFLGMGIFQLLRKLRLPAKLCILSGMGAVIVYGWFTGMASSTGRSVIMTLISLGARWTGRTCDRKTALVLAALILLVPSPLMITQPGFLLSFAAVGCLMLCPEEQGSGPLPQDKDNSGTKRSGAKKSWLWDGQRVLDFLKNHMISPIYVTAGMFPVLSGCFYEISMYSLIINLAVIPLMNFVYPAMLVAALTAPLAGHAGFFLYRFIEGILGFYEALCRLSLKLPGAAMITGQMSVPAICLLYGIFGAGAVFHHRARPAGARKKPVFLAAALCSLLCGICLLLAPQRPQHMTVTMVDVGQGDCFLLQTPDGKNILVDGGSSDEKNVGKYTIIPFLKARGVRSLDAVFLSHMDEDHICGVEEILSSSVWPSSWGGDLRIPGSVEIKNIIVSRTAQNDDGYEKLRRLCDPWKTVCAAASAGEELSFGDVKIRVLWPGEEMSDFAGDKNDLSLVLHIFYGAFDMLFTGDIGASVESGIVGQMEAWGISGCDVLKVAHHGSKNSTEDYFLSHVRPKIALISCGRDNFYGHPHGELLRRLEMAKCKTYVTSWDGELIIETDGKYIKTVVWGQGDRYNRKRR